MKRRFVFLGPPASGKGTQAALVSKKYGFAPLSTGALLRRELEAGHVSARDAGGWASTGGLAPDAVVFELVLRWLDQHPDAFIFDGFPRTTAQAEMLDAELERRGTPLDAVVRMDLSEEEIRARVLSRLTCPGCGATFSDRLAEEISGMKCPQCESTLVRRKDDTVEVLNRRLIEYREKTQPLSDYYGGTGRLFCVDASLERNEVFARLCEIIEEDGR